MKRTIALLACLLVAPLHAGETLPDSARVQEDDTGAMAERFSAPVMDSEEMEGLYLEAPGVVDNAEIRGLEGLNDKERYTETDLRFRERFQNNPSAAPQLPPEQPLRRPDIPATPGSPVQRL
ncbi:MAG: hypothetical protein P1U64_06530 [Alcanivoracaceae bacterium]|jgi:hypothetical protein|nr:hypothetical protein [Alcanivoracaceae bacterium]